MFVRLREMFPSVQLDGLKISYPNWVQNLILKNKLDYYPSEGKWIYEGNCLHDGDCLVKIAEKIIGVSAEDFLSKYEVVL